MGRDWRLRPGITVHPLPYGGAFVVDEDALALIEIGQELTELLAGEGVAGARDGEAPPPRLAAEVRQGLSEGWLIEQD